MGTILATLTVSTEQVHRKRRHVDFDCPHSCTTQTVIVDDGIQIIPLQPDPGPLDRNPRLRIAQKIIKLAFLMIFVALIIYYFFKTLFRLLRYTRVL